MRYRFPATVQQVNFEQMNYAQIMTLADWLGYRRRLAACKSAAERQTLIKELCLADPDRAQQGYEIIILKKVVAPAGAVDKDVEKRFYEVVTDIMSKHADVIDEKAEEAIKRYVADVRTALDQQAKKALKDAAEQYRPIVVKEGSKIRKVKGVLPVEFQRMVELASKRIPILLVGPAGCGKTYLAEKLAEALGLEYSDQSCSEGMSENVFNGLLLPIGKGGQFEHVASPWMIRYEEGGVMLLDEIDAGDSNATTYMNKAVANPFYTVAQRWKKPVCRKHKDFVLIAAANTFGAGADAMYVGRNQLDAATLDRFKIGTILMDYSQEVEQSVSLGNDDLCEWAWNIRRKIRENKLRRIMSTRVIKDLATMTDAYGWKREEWEATYFTGWSDAERKLVTA